MSTATATIRPVRTIVEEHTGDTLVIASNGRREEVVGTVRRLGNAYRVMNADASRQLALVSLESQAIAWFKYNH